MNINEEEDIIKKRTVCFSGHRPEKLPLNGYSGSRVTRYLKSILYKEILDSITAGYDRFITGLARGVDLWAGEILMELKAQGENISIIAVKPHKGHGDNFTGEEKFSLGRLISMRTRSYALPTSTERAAFSAGTSIWLTIRASLSLLYPTTGAARELQ